MAAEIKWSDNAAQDYNTIINYLPVEWNEEIAERFIEVVESKLQQLVIHPYVGMISLRNNKIRSIAITKHNRLYYRFSGKA